MDFAGRAFDAFAEKLPFDAASFDSAVITFTLCSIERAASSTSSSRGLTSSSGEANAGVRAESTCTATFRSLHE